MHSLLKKLNNMKNTWNGINRLINDKKNRKQVISSFKRPDDNSSEMAYHDLSIYRVYTYTEHMITLYTNS